MKKNLEASPSKNTLKVFSGSWGLAFSSTVVGGVEDGGGIEVVARVERLGRRHVQPI